MLLRRFAFVLGPGILLVSALSVSPVVAEVSAPGIIETAPASCELESHWITDTCTGEIRRLRSSLVDLGAYSCDHVVAIGDSIGVVCPTIDVREMATLPPPCRVEVLDLTFSLSAEGPRLAWKRLPCGAVYDVIRGVLGEPAGGGCRATGDCLLPLYCRKSPGYCDGLGTCRSKPPACPAVYIPVCGCDGVTYSNECVAAQAGASVACDGVCPCPEVCTDPDAPCLDVGPVMCRLNDTSISEGGFLETDNPGAGQSFFYLVRARGGGAVGETSYGYTYPEGQERHFAVDCPR